MLDAITVQAPPLPGRILMNQDWVDLSYLHWALPPERVAGLLPSGIRPDVLEGRTYVGLVPFRMANAGFGRRGRVPYFGDFLETNLRLYSVDETGRRGVVFLTLDCERAAVVAGARIGFGTRYRWASMRHDVVASASSTTHRYRSTIRGPGPSVTSDLAIEVGPVAEPTELDHFLSARWGLHTRLAGRTVYIPNQHEPWPLHRARVTSLSGTLLEDAGFGDLMDREPDHVAFSPGVHAEFGFPTTAAVRRDQ